MSGRKGTQGKKEGSVDNQDSFGDQQMALLRGETTGLLKPECSAKTQAQVTVGDLALERRRAQSSKPVRLGSLAQLGSTWSSRRALGRQ